MPYQFTILTDPPLIVKRHWGDVDLADVLASVHDVWEAPGFDRALNGIADFREADLQFDQDKVEMLAGFLGDPRASSGRWALLVAAPVAAAFAHAFARNPKARLSSQVFGSVEAATAWLDVPPDVLTRTGWPPL